MVGLVHNGLMHFVLAAVKAAGGLYEKSFETFPRIVKVASLIIVSALKFHIGFIVLVTFHLYFISKKKCTLS